MPRSNWLRAILAVWLVLNLVLSISPLSFKLRLHTIGTYHNIGHFVIYALTGILLWLITDRWFLRVFSFLGGLAVAFAQEWAENKLYHAGFEWKDIRMDLAGLVTGYALMLLILALTMDERARQRY